jgi:hypothetical protein
MPAKLHVDNAMQCSPFWSETIPQSDHLTTCFTWNCTVDTPEITGLLVDVMYMTKGEHLGIEMAE